MLIGLGLAIAMLVIKQSDVPREGRSGPSINPPELNFDPELQAKRQSLIDKLVSEGVFYKIERPADLPHVWVTPRFRGLAFDEKSKFVEVVFARYYPDGGKIGDVVVLKDSQTGNRIGTYSRAGLELD